MADFGITSCFHCHSDQVIADLSQGIVVCRGCGTLQTDRLVDESPEWVNHEGKADMNRAGGGALDSTKSRLFGLDAPKSKKRRRDLGPDDLEEARAKKSVVTNRVRDVCVMVDNIIRSRELTEEIKNVAFVIADKAHAKGLFHSVKDKDMAGALIYLACGQLNITTNLKEVSSYTSSDYRDVAKLVVELRKAFPDLQKSEKKVGPDDLVDSYCAKLNIPMAKRTEAVEVVRKAMNMQAFGRLSPAALAGGVLCLLFLAKPEDPETSYPSKEIEDLVEASGVSAKALKSAYTIFYEKKEKVLSEKTRTQMEELGVDFLHPTEI